MDLKYKNKNDPTWEETSSDKDDLVNEKETRKRPRSLEEIQQGVYLEQQKERERIRRLQEAEKALEDAKIAHEKKLEEERLKKQQEEEKLKKQAEVNALNNSDDTDSEDDFDESCATTVEIIKHRAKKFFLDALKWTKKHKVITGVIAAVLVLIIAAAGTVNYFLDKINYVGDESKVEYITLSTGEVINVKRLKPDENGIYTLKDGRRVNAESTVWNLDGSIVFFDGSYVLTNGIIVQADGTTFYPDQTLVFQDGTYYTNTEIQTNSEGYLFFSCGVNAHCTSFVCAKDGTCTPKKSIIKNLKYNPTTPWNALNGKTSELESLSEEDAEDYEFEKALSGSKKELADLDEEIKRNYNNNEIWYNNDIQNILIMGIDEGSKIYPYGRSDAMIILSVNKRTHAVKMISLSRAAYVGIQGYDNTRLNHAHGLGGASLAIDTIERNYKVRIDNFVETGFSTFKQIVNVLDGVSINLTSAEAKALKKKIEAAKLEYKGAGTYNLNGDLALEYVRLRKIDTDRERTGRQRKVLLSIASKVKTLNLFQLTTLANRILPLITTNMTKAEILGQLTNVGSYLSGDIKQYVVPKGGYPLTLVDNFEVLKLDWTAEVKYIHEVMYGDVVPSYYKK